VYRRAVLLSLVSAASLGSGGCAVDPGIAEDPAGQTQTALLFAPPVLNLAVIPADYISNKMNLFLLDTELQVSQTTGDTLEFPLFVGNCHPNTAAINACIADACGGLPGRAHVQCTVACRQQHQICVPVCSSTNLLSFIRWGGIAKQASLQDDPETCSPSTCPACPVPTAVPSLHDEQLFIPTFSKEIDPPPPFDPFIVTCRVNQWQFHVQENLSVTSATTGLTLHLPGTTGSPAIPCNNAPDISAQDVGLDLTFHPAVTANGLAVSAEGALDGTFSGGILDVIVNVDADIKGAVHTQLADILNSGNKPAEYAAIFKALIGQFLTDNQLPAVTTLEGVSPTDQGLVVQYF
jgi:hypothetical protein